MLYQPVNIRLTEFAESIQMRYSSLAPRHRLNGHKHVNRLTSIVVPCENRTPDPVDPTPKVDNFRDFCHLFSYTRSDYRLNFRDADTKRECAPAVVIVPPSTNCTHSRNASSFSLGATKPVNYWNHASCALYHKRADSEKTNC